MKKSVRLNLYTKLCLHPKFDSLPERLQEALTYMASGYTDHELMRMYKISHGTAWSYRETIFKRFGFKVYDKNRAKGHRSPTRAMTQEEIVRSGKLQ